MSGQKPATSCNSSSVAASGALGKTMPPTVCTLAILASSGALPQRSIASVSATSHARIVKRFLLVVGLD
jgi:hypothetical protein